MIFVGKIYSTSVFSAEIVLPDNMSVYIHKKDWGCWKKGMNSICCGHPWFEVAERCWTASKLGWLRQQVRVAVGFAKQTWFGKQLSAKSSTSPVFHPTCGTLLVLSTSWIGSSLMPGISTRATPKAQSHPSPQWLGERALFCNAKWCHPSFCWSPPCHWHLGKVHLAQEDSRICTKAPNLPSHQRSRASPEAQWPWPFQSMPWRTWWTPHDPYAPPQAARWPCENTWRIPGTHGQLCRSSRPNAAPDNARTKWCWSRCHTTSRGLGRSTRPWPLDRLASVPCTCHRRGNPPWPCRTYLHPDGWKWP